MVEIAKALSLNARIIIMDEPTSSLTLTETKRLLELVCELSGQGVSIVYISHRLGEIDECADRVVVLRDGKNAGELSHEEATHDRLVSMMVGREIKSFYVQSDAPKTPRLFQGPERCFALLSQEIGFVRRLPGRDPRDSPAWSARDVLRSPRRSPVWTPVPRSRLVSGRQTAFRSRRAARCH